ncbi:MAG: hypothetical protein H0X37_27460 [Herpetosiphonaceae bacterium]|nr:hypothetical protein [Herpetosiphonaceae bacterium]
MDAQPNSPVLGSVDAVKATLDQLTQSAAPAVPTPSPGTGAYKIVHAGVGDFLQGQFVDEKDFGPDADIARLIRFGAIARREQMHD